MEQIKQVIVDGRTFNIGQASAREQRKLLTLIGAKISMSSATGGVEEIDVALLMGTLLGIDEETLGKVCDIVLFKTVENGQKEVVTIDYFQGKMNTFMKLVAEAIKVNLNDFFIWLDEQNSVVRKRNTETIEAMIRRILPEVLNNGVR